MKGSELVSSAAKGTRPGHPYADVVFSFAFHQVFEDFAKVLDEDDLRPLVPSTDPADISAPPSFVRFPIPLFFHEFVVLIVTKHPMDLHPACSAALHETATCLAKRGM